MNLLSYTIKEVDAPNGDFTVLFVFDDKSTSTQVIHFGSVETAEALDRAVRDYAEAYAAGKAVEAATTVALPDAIAALIGKKQSVPVNGD